MIEILYLLIVLFFSTTPMSFGSTTSRALLSTGTIDYSSIVSVKVNSSTIMGTNALSLGFQISYGSLGLFLRYSQLRELAKEAQFKLVRFFDGLNSSYIPSMMPCEYFNETSKTGTYNWTVVDYAVEKIFEIGAEPLVSLGVSPQGKIVLPPGMTTNLTTGLPHPESYASYATEWVKHFKAKGWNVRFFEILNEPWVYFGALPINTTRLGYYMRLFAVCRSAMKQENAAVYVSFDFIHKKPVLDYWLDQNGPDVDSLNFHKYDDSKLPAQYTDAEMFVSAERLESWYSIVEAQQLWLQRRGEHLPMICSESNLNGASPKTDVRIQQMTGAVWLALLLRSEILAGVSYHIYYELSSGYHSDSYGFGMIHRLNHSRTFKPWYAYYLQHLIGNNLNLGDLIVESTTSSEDIRSLAWIHQGTLNLLLISKANASRKIRQEGVAGPSYFYKIDNTIPWENPAIQEGIVNTTDVVHLKGYTVILLQTALSP